MVVGPVPEQREDGGLIEDRRRGEYAELPGIFHHGEISAGKGDEQSGGLHSRRGKTELNKKLFKKRETRRSRDPSTAMHA